MIASVVVPVAGAGLEIEVTIIPIQRGVGATIDYGVAVWQVKGNTRSVIPSGENMLPPELVQSAKTKLWESIRP